MTSLGTAHARIEAQDKVGGTAHYTADRVPPGQQVVHCVHVGAQINLGRVTGVDDGAAMQMPGVLGVMWHGNAPRLGESEDAELHVLQGPDVHYRGQIVAAVIAISVEQARAAAESLDIDYEQAEGFDNVLHATHPARYTPEEVNAGFPAEARRGDPEGAIAKADHVVDNWYSTPAMHNAPMEPHATIASWEQTDDGETLTVWDSTQAPSGVQGDLATLFDVESDNVRVVAEHVGGGFGGKGSTRPNAVLAAMAARFVGRPVRVVLPRSATFAFVGYRTPTFSRVALGADGEGNLEVVVHDSVQQTSKIVEFVEQTAEATRHIYDTEHIKTTHEVAALDVSTPRWMRAPGESPGIYALESAVDELAHELGLDPIDLRTRNEPDVDPATGTAFSSRNVVSVLRQGADQFGWELRDPTPGSIRRGRTLVGMGVALASYPTMTSPSTALAVAQPDGSFDVSVAASDIGTGARTVLTQIAADALQVQADRVRLHLGDSALPKAPGAGGSAGTSSWGFAVHKACEGLRDNIGSGPVDRPVEHFADTTADVEAASDLHREAFGAHFAEVAVDVDTGEVTVDRMLGVFAVGKVLNPRLARSQLIGGMTFGLGMALMEEGHPDAQYGGFGNENLADYHVPSHADVRDIEAVWIEEVDDNINPMGSKGIGEIGNVGSAAAIANAVFNATGVRVRDLPVRPDKIVEQLDPRYRD
ncbi:xanthine dehydrogenase molybdenum binding subunit apoprotein [Williamsia muralis]|uniref:Xanthine dehydrogenase molybdenum binding subunit apoprotein n=1 Tax=Williamsia marianensis TaxID=85044 RepID=A0A495K3S0_WILMA|nr:xanthine dehydrogenase family protein molybdopterin-binding subunit [Williamsia muralis]RKR95455.1 xanthine dehydrogenase molybdenum binding subunit apoprotein [Williamsia muralis]